MSNIVKRLEDQGGPESREITLPVEWPVEDIEVTDMEVARAARAIRLYYYRQIPLLRQIPYLALEADGRGGWLDHYGTAYCHCMMPIHQVSETWGHYATGSYDMFIELRSGVLIGVDTSKSTCVVTASETVKFGGETNWNMASDKEVYVKLAHQLEENRFIPIDQINYMQEKIKQPYHNEPEYLQRALENKAMNKRRLDKMMAALPVEQVIATLRAQGFDLP